MNSYSNEQLQDIVNQVLDKIENRQPVYCTWKELVQGKTPEAQKLLKRLNADFEKQRIEREKQEAKEKKRLAKQRKEQLERNKVWSDYWLKVAQEKRELEAQQRNQLVETDDEFLPDDETETSKHWIKWRYSLSDKD